MTRRPPSVRSAREGYTASNSIAAQLIIQDAARYPVGSLARQWAFLVLAKMVPTVRGPLLKAAA